VATPLHALPPILQSATLVDILRKQALEQPNSQSFTFLIDGENQAVHLTYGQLDRKVRSIASQLQALDMTGGNALLLFPSGLEYVCAFMGCLYAGVVAIPSSPPNPAQMERTLDSIQRIMADARPRVVLTTVAVRSMAEKLFAGMPQWQTLQWLATDDIPEQNAEDWQEPQINGDTLAMLQYTSGSTAAPKGVMLSHGNILHNQSLIPQRCLLTKESTHVTWLPLHHNLGLMLGVALNLYLGAHSVLMSPISFLQRPYRWLRAISQYQAHTSTAPNFAYDLCAQKISPQELSTLDLRSWELAMVGGEPVQQDILARFAKIFAPQGFRPEAFLPGYGMAEITVMISVGKKEELPSFKALSKEFLEQGQAVDGPMDSPDTIKAVGYELFPEDQQLAIVGPEKLQPLPPGEIGEIWVKSPSVAQGYWGQPAKTAETFQAYLPDLEGGPFLRTGDLGFIKDNQLFITGRCKDLIIINGRNHYPQDLELTVQKSHPSIRSGGCAAFSLTNTDGERLVIVAEIDVPEGTTPDLKAITLVVQQAIGAGHGLRASVALLKAGSIPKTAIGKAQRFACRAGYLAGTLAFWTPPSGELPPT
jgi:acyl-CoA synthetase (AMP-forming)/AMP-acid ligase II